MEVVRKLTTKVHAHAAALTHRRPARHMQVILVYGADGGQLTIMALSRIVRKEGAKVGVVTANFVEIAGERVEGSDQADVQSDPFRLQGLLAQMRRAGCTYALIEVPAQLPPHGFAGLQPAMVIMRRQGDTHLTEPQNAGRTAGWKQLTGLAPRFLVINRDDPCYEPVGGLAETAIMTFGTHEKAECRLTGVEIHPKGCAASLLVDHQTELHIATGLTGKTAIYSLVAAAAAAYLLHMPISAIEDGIIALPDEAGVTQYVPAQRPYQIVLDSNTTPDGVAETLETVKRFTKNRLIVVVSATLLQPPDWRPILGELAAAFADRLVVTDGEYTDEESGQTVRHHILQGIAAAGGEARTDEVQDRIKALEKSLSIARRGDTIVVLATTQRPYRQVGSERQPWSDRSHIDALLG